MPTLDQLIEKLLVEAEDFIDPDTGKYLGDVKGCLRNIKSSSKPISARLLGKDLQDMHYVVVDLNYPNEGWGVWGWGNSEMEAKLYAASREARQDGDCKGFVVHPIDKFPDTSKGAFLRA